MKRFQGEKLGAGARIAVISNDALGNFVVITPLLQMLRSQLAPSSIDYYGGVRTWELQTASDLFEWTFPLFGSAPSEKAAIAKERRGYGLIVNIERASEIKVFAGSLCNSETFVCGPCGDVPGHSLDFASDARGELWADSEWIAPDLTARYPFLKSGFIGEIFCRLCYLDGEIPSYKIPCEEPDRPIPEILISAAATLPDKIWPTEEWKQVVRFLETKGCEIGLIGAHPIQQRIFWKGNEIEEELSSTGSVKDLRGKLTLPEVAGALKRARLVITLDNGILHMAVAMKTPTVGIYRYGIHRLWAPPFERLTVLAPEEGKGIESISIDRACEAVQSAL